MSPKMLEAVAAVKSSQPSSENVLRETDNIKIEDMKENVESDTNTIDIKDEPGLLSKASANGNINDGTSVGVKSESRCEIKAFHKKPSLQHSGTTIANRPKQFVANGTADPPNGNVNAEKSKSTNSVVVQDLMKRSKPIKSSLSSLNPVTDSLSTSITQASPIKSYLTISSIDKTDPDSKTATTKNMNVRNGKDEPNKKTTIGDITPTASPPVVIKITRTTTTSSSNTTVVSASTPVMSVSELNKESAVPKLSKSKDTDKLSSASKTILKQNSAVSMTKESLPPVKFHSPTVESPASSNMQNGLSIPPPPLVTLTTVPSTVTSASSTLAKNASYLLPNTKIPSSLEISVAQAKDSSTKTNNASVLSMHRVISPPKPVTNGTVNNTNASQPVTNGQSKQAEPVTKKASVKQTSDNSMGQASEKYPALSISKTTMTSAANRYKPNEIILSTNKESDSSKTIFSPSMPNILPEVSITLNRHPEPPSKRLRPETSYDVSCFKPTETLKKESVCNGVPPLTPIITSCKNIPNSPIKSLNKFVQPANPTRSMGKNQPANKNQLSKVEPGKGVAIKRSLGTPESIPIKRAAIENSSSSSTTKTNGTAKVSNGNTISPTAAKSNGQDVVPAGAGKKESTVGRHLSMPKLIDIHTSQYFQMKAAQSAKGRVSQQFANAMSNGNAPTILYVKPPPLGEGNNDALDLSPTSKSPTVGCNSDSPQQQQSNQQQLVTENKKSIPSVPPLIPKVLQSVGKNSDCKSPSMAILPKLERKISPIMRMTDKKTSPSGLHNRKAETKSSNLSPLKTSPSENCKSPVSTSLAATHSSPTKSLPSPIMASANLGGWPVPVPFHPAMIPVQFYGMPSWLNSYQGPLPGHPLMGDRINPPTSTHQQAGMR